jgi:hypothetical protein
MNGMNRLISMWPHQMVNENFGWSLSDLPETKVWHHTLFALWKSWFLKIMGF